MTCNWLELSYQGVLLSAPLATPRSLTTSSAIRHPSRARLAWRSDMLSSCQDARDKAIAATVLCPPCFKLQSFAQGLPTQQGSPFSPASGWSCPRQLSGARLIRGCCFLLCWPRRGRSQPLLPYAILPVLGLLGAQTCYHLARTRVTRPSLQRYCAHRALNCSLSLKASQHSRVAPSLLPHAWQAKSQRTKGEGSSPHPYGGL